MIRSLIVVFIGISAILATIQYKSNVTFIAQLMGISWGALAGSFLAPFLYSLYAKWVSKAACFVSFLFSCTLMIGNILIKESLPEFLQSPINCGAFAMLAGLVIVPAVSMITKRPDTAFLNKAFACYEQETHTHRKNSLGE